MFDETRISRSNSRDTTETKYKRASENKCASFRQTRSVTLKKNCEKRRDRAPDSSAHTSNTPSDARASLGVFDVCAELSGARSRRFSQFFFNVTDRVCRKDAHLFSDARLYFVSVVSREFDREIRVSSNKKQTPVERSTDARYR